MWHAADVSRCAETPRTKNQTTFKTKSQQPAVVGILVLKVVWFLVLGSWCFRAAAPGATIPPPSPPNLAGPADPTRRPMRPALRSPLGRYGFAVAAVAVG